MGQTNSKSPSACGAHTFFPYSCTRRVPLEMAMGGGLLPLVVSELAPAPALAEAYDRKIASLEITTARWMA